MKTPKERGNLDLLELTCQLHSRSLIVDTKEMHNAYIEAKQEMESRLNELLEALKDCLIDVTRRCTDLKLDCTKYSTWQKATQIIKKAEL